MSKHLTGGGQATVGCGDGVSMEDIKLIGKVLAVLGTIFLFAFRWWRKRRERNPKACKTFEVFVGGALAVLLILVQMANWTEVANDAIGDIACQQVVGIVNGRLMLWEANGESVRDAGTLEKAGIRCPDGGTFSIENGAIRCSKHHR